MLRDKIKPSTKVENKNTISQLVAELLESVTIVHKFHLLAKAKSYSEHIALGEFYEEIDNFADAIYEQFAGQTSTIDIPEAVISDSVPISYLEKLVIFVEQVRISNPNFSHLQNQMDEVKSLIYQTLYKLRNLK